MNISPISQWQNPIPNCFIGSFSVTQLTVTRIIGGNTAFVACLICSIGYIGCVWLCKCTSHSKSNWSHTVLFLAVFALQLFKIVQVCSSNNKSSIPWSSNHMSYVANKTTVLKRQNLHSTSAKNSTVVSTDRSAATRSTPWRSRRLAYATPSLCGKVTWNDLR